MSLDADSRTDLSAQGTAVVPVETNHSVTETLKRVLDDETINVVFGGKDRRLSAAQAGLAAAVTVKMQDRLLEQAKLAHEREMSLIGGFWKLYKTPIIRFPSRHDQPHDATSSATKGRPKWPEFFSWGNSLGAGALLITAAALWYTSTTANYKDKWEGAEGEKKELQQKLEASQKAAEDQAAEWGKAVARAEALEEANKSLTANQKEMGVELRKLIDSNGKAKGELAKQAATASSERTFQRLYENSQRENEKLRRENAELMRNTK